MNKPNKKKKGTGFENVKKSEKPEQVPEPLETVIPLPISDTEKEFYVLQIKDLEKKLARYQRLCDELSIKNEDHTSRFDQVIGNKNDIIASLNEIIKTKEKELKAISEKFSNLKKEHESSMSEYRVKLDDANKEVTRVAFQLKEATFVHAIRLRSLQEFRFRQREHEKRMRSLQEELQTKELKHINDMRTLDQNAVKYKNAMKKSIEAKIEEIAAEYRNYMSTHIAQTTKNVIFENMVVSAELKKISENTLVLIDENENLKEDNRKQKERIDILEWNEKYLARKHAHAKKFVQMLAAKCSDLKGMLDECKRRLRLHTDLSRELEGERCKNLDLVLKNDTLVLKIGSLDKCVAKYEETLHSERLSAGKLKQVLTDAAVVLNKSLAYHKVEDEALGLVKRGQTFQQLLCLLNNAEKVGVSLSLVDCQHIHLPQQIKQTTALAPLKPKRHKESIHYQLGDLGLMPRDGYVPRPLVLGCSLSGKVQYKHKSVAVQTESLQQSAFYVDKLLKDLPQEATLLIQNLGSASKKATYRPNRESLLQFRKLTGSARVTQGLR